MVQDPFGIYLALERIYGFPWDLHGILLKFRQIFLGILLNLERFDEFLEDIFEILVDSGAFYKAV